MALCIFFGDGVNCWKDLSLASNNNLWTSGNCESCLHALEYSTYSNIKIPFAVHSRVLLMSGSYPQVSGFMV